MLSSLYNNQQAGNAAFQQQRYAAALEQYTLGLGVETQDAMLRAMLFCNRAAALQVR